MTRIGTDLVLRDPALAAGVRAAPRVGEVRAIPRSREILTPSAFWDASVAYRSSGRVLGVRRVDVLA